MHLLDDDFALTRSKIEAVSSKPCYFDTQSHFLFLILSSVLTLLFARVIHNPEDSRRSLNVTQNNRKRSGPSGLMYRRSAPDTRLLELHSTHSAFRCIPVTPVMRPDLSSSLGDLEENTTSSLPTLHAIKTRRRAFALTHFSP